MNAIEGLLASLLNPNPGVQRAGLLGPNAMAQTGLGPEQLARYHQMSGLGGGQAMPAPQAAPAGAMQPPAAPQAPDQMQTASTSPSGGGFMGGLGDAIGGLFNPKGAQKNRTVQLLMQDGLDEGTATLVAQDKTSLNHYLRQRAFGEGPKADEYQQRTQVAQQYGLQGDEAKSFILTGKMPDEGGGQSLVNAGKGRLYDPNKGEWITAPDMGTDAPTIQTFYDDKGLPYNAQWDAQKGEWAKVGGSKAPSGMSIKTNPDGTVEVVQGVGGAGQRVTEGQSKDIYYYTNGSNSNAVLSNLDTQLTDWTQANADKIPLGLGNYAREPSFRQAHQAGRQFLAAILRKESGGAITASEWNDYGPMFLPVPGDDPATIEQKRRGREVALEAIKSGLGTAAAIAEANKITLGIPDVAKKKQPVVIDGYTIEEVE